MTLVCNAYIGKKKMKCDYSVPNSKSSENIVSWDMFMCVLQAMQHSDPHSGILTSACTFNNLYVTTP